MIVQCSNCRARFRVAEEKIPARGAMMRCTRCASVFKISRSGASEPAPAQVPAPPQAPQVDSAPLDQPAAGSSASEDEDPFDFEAALDRAMESHAAEQAGRRESDFPAPQSSEEGRPPPPNLPPPPIDAQGFPQGHEAAEQAQWRPPGLDPAPGSLDFEEQHFPGVQAGAQGREMEPEQQTDPFDDAFAAAFDDSLGTPRQDDDFLGNPSTSSQAAAARSYEQRPAAPTGSRPVYSDDFGTYLSGSSAEGGEALRGGSEDGDSVSGFAVARAGKAPETQGSAALALDPQDASARSEAGLGLDGLDLSDFDLTEDEGASPSHSEESAQAIFDVGVFDSEESASHPEPPSTPSAASQRAATADESGDKASEALEWGDFAPSSSDSHPAASKTYPEGGGDSLDSLELSDPFAGLDPAAGVMSGASSDEGSENSDPGLVIERNAPPPSLFAEPDRQSVELARLTPSLKPGSPPISAPKPKPEPRRPLSQAQAARIVRRQRAKRQAALSMVNVLAAMVVLFVALVALASIRSPRPLTLSDMGFPLVWLALGMDAGVQSEPLLAQQLKMGVSTSHSGEEFFWVSGMVENVSGARRRAVQVKVEVLKGKQVLGRAHSLVGLDADPERLFRHSGDNDALQLQLLGQRPVPPLRPRSRAPFIAIFPLSGHELVSTRVRVKVSEGIPQTLLKAGAKASPASDDEDEAAEEAAEAVGGEVAGSIDRDVAPDVDRDMDRDINQETELDGHRDIDGAVDRIDGRAEQSLNGNRKGTL